MDHPHYDYSPLPTRTPLRWPGDATLAAFVVVYLEHWALAPTDGAHRDPRFVGEYGSFFPDYRTWTQREYGNRVGIFRVLDALDQAGITPAIAVNAAVITNAPGLVERIAARGVEVIAHGRAATEMLTSALTPDAERAVIRESLDTLERATGHRPVGWVGQDFGESTRTPQLLAEAGLEYALDWPNDDQPYVLKTTPAIVSIPNQADWDDVQMQWLRRIPAAEHAKHALAAFETLREDGVKTARTFGLGVHPWLFGMPNRIKYLREMLIAMRSHDRVWWTSPREIARSFTDQTRK